jgi:LysR family transcriptional repressor of citA
VDLRVLRTFVSAARLENFRETAERLSLSQPTVSAQIRELEEEIGEPLFDRAGRRVRLNPAGEMFLPHAEQILKDYASAMQDLSDHRRGEVERVAIAVSPEPARSLLPRALRHLLSVRPSAVVSVEVVPSREVGGIVASGAADVGIAQVPADPSQNRLRCRELMRDRGVLAARHDGNDHDQAPAYWRQLLEEQILISHGHPGYWNALLQRLEDEGIHPRTMPVTQVELTKRFVEEGLGVSFLPERSVRRELLEGRLMEVPAPGLALPDAVTFMLLPDAPLAEPVRQFIDAVRESLHLQGALAE